MEASQISQREQLDCQRLHSFISRDGASNCEDLREILVSRSSEDRRRILQAYRAKYNQDFIYQISRIQRRNKFLGGDLYSIVKGGMNKMPLIYHEEGEEEGEEGDPLVSPPTNSLPTLSNMVHLHMMEPHDRDAKLLRDALHGSADGTDVLSEVICARSSFQFQLIKQAYRTHYGTNLEQDISLKTQGYMKQVLIALSSVNGSDGSRVDVSLGMCDAKILYEAMECGASTDQRTILSILTKRNIEQLRTVFQCYNQLYGHHISKFFKQRKHGEFGRTLSSVSRCISFPHKYYAKQLRIMWASGKWTAECVVDLMIRIIVSQSADLDIRGIRSSFSVKSDRPLESAMQSLMNSSYHAGMVGEVLLAIMKSS